MKIKTAEFVISNTDYRKCPDVSEQEFAFIGRSNVGKSSLINMLTERKSLAKTSGKPGKTQLINHFFINKKWYLVDLPGYGWAQVSKKLKEEWDLMIRNYIKFRKNLSSLFILIDSRIPPQKIDIEFINWAGSNQIPFAIIFTKADKHNSPKSRSNVDAFKNELLKHWDELPAMFVTSSTKKHGQKEVLDYIEKII